MPPPLILSTLPPPLNAQPRPIKAPSPLVRWRLSSRLPLVCRLVVASPVVTCLRLASPFVMQPPHASIVDTPSLFGPAGCRIVSLCTASASQRAAASQLAVLLPSPKQRRSCRRCAGVFAVIAIAIVTLVARCQAGIVALVIIVIYIRCYRCRPRHCHRHRCTSHRPHHRRLCCPSRHCHCHRHRCRCPSRRRHRHRIIVDVIACRTIAIIVNFVAHRAVTIIIDFVARLAVTIAVDLSCLQKFVSSEFETAVDKIKGKQTTIKSPASQC